MKKILIILFSLLTLTCFAYNIKLGWDKSVDLSVTGYKLYYKIITSTNYTFIDVGNTNVCALTGLSNGVTYIYYVTCYNGAGLESDPSNSVTNYNQMFPVSIRITLTN